MSILLHLSDLHLFASPREQEIIFDELVSALQHPPRTLLRIYWRLDRSSQ